MNWKTYPLRFLYLYRLGKWLVAKVGLIKNDKLNVLLARNVYGSIIPDWIREYNGDISKIQFRLISFPFEIVDADRVRFVKFQRVSVEWNEKLVRLDE